jgi:hypothetical protein
VLVEIGPSAVIAGTIVGFCVAIDGGTVVDVGLKSSDGVGLYP